MGRDDPENRALSSAMGGLPATFMGGTSMERLERVVSGSTEP